MNAGLVKGGFSYIHDEQEQPRVEFSLHSVILKSLAPITDRIRE
jgi:hypothetical protein